MITEEKKLSLERFNEGRKKYKLMDFEGALKDFTHALKIDSSDGPSKIYYVRCKHYIANPPAEDWDGVFVMSTK